MIKNKKVLIAALVLLIALAGIGGGVVLGKNDINNISDYSAQDFNLAVSEVLKSMPEISEELDQIRDVRKDGDNGYISNDLPVKELLDPKKIQFRLEVENKLTNSGNKNLSTIAQKYTDNYLRAISIAEKVYGVTVSQEEVTKYIDKNVAPFTPKEKEHYAKALGLTTYELDYVFDRDIYVMDTLWSKLIPVLMEKYPQQSDEDDNAYLERIKKEFYSN
jgi:hypothetical protein